MLVRPDIRYQASVVVADAEFGDEWADGSGQYLGPRVGLQDPARFAEWVAMLLADADPDAVRPDDRVPSTLLWIVDGDEFIGFVAIRHRLNAFLLREGGHIGYSIRPSARRRGWATRALAEALPLARDLGIDSVLVCCHESNAGSRAVIEANGGVYEDSRNGTRRYWIDAR
jgi:predicted acetyltransferase